MSHNKDLDVLGALGIFIVMIVHVVFWNGLFADSFLRTLILIEMPLIFAVSGAKNFLSQKEGLSLMGARIRRIIIPYWIYGLVCAVLIADQAGAWFPGLLRSWINPFYGQISGTGYLQYFTWAMWFVPVYLITMVIFPLLKYFYRKTQNHILISMLPLFVGIGVVIGHDLLGWTIPNYRVFFYLIFLYWGMLCVGNQWIGGKKKESAVLAILALAITIALLVSGKYGLDMLANKDNCNFIFLTYNFFWQCVLNLCLPVLRKIVSQLGQFTSIQLILVPFRDNGYTIYLFHALVFASISTVIGQLGLYQILLSGNDFLIALAYWLILTILSSLLARAVGKIEKI